MTVELQSEICRVFEIQRRHQYVVKAKNADERKAKLRRLRDVLLADAAAIEDALHQDLRRPRLDDRSPEIRGVAADIEDVLENLDAWMKPTEIAPSPGSTAARAMVRYEPRGVCLIYGPWNFPFLLVLQPLIAALAAGNCCVVKPSELAPATSNITAKILRDAFDEREVAVLEGGVDIASALLELPFDHIFFTGSQAVGKIVMAAAAKHLTSVTLELGGKCPAVIDEGIDLKSAAQQIAFGRMYNAGQLCLAPDHVWVRAEQRDELVGHIESAVRQMFYPGGELNKDMLGSIIDRRNLERVRGYLEDAVSRGARIAFGGQIEEAARTVHPTALVDVPLDAKIMQEEIFGPVLPVLTYERIEEVTEAIRRGGKPLALYVFSDREPFIEEVLQNTQSGGVTVNGVLQHAAERRLPFGGVNQSGMGRYHGVHGFRELSHERSVLVQR